MKRSRSPHPRVVEEDMSDISMPSDDDSDSSSTSSGSSSSLHLDDSDCYSDYLPNLDEPGPASEGNDTKVPSAYNEMRPAAESRRNSGLSHRVPIVNPNENDDFDSETEDGTGWFEVEEGNDPGFKSNFTFSELHGIKHCPPKNSPPVDYFRLFFTIQLLDSFVKYTNKYAEEFLSLNINSPEHSRIMRSWKPVTQLEMLAFIITLINMGISKRPSIVDYWSKSPSQFFPWFFTMFTQERFLLIMKFFHMVDTSNIPRSRHPNYDPCAHYQVLIDHFNRVSLFHYTPREQLAINVSKISRPTYLQTKRHRRHQRVVKLWSVNESLSHYCLSFFIYKGANSLEDKREIRKNGLGYYVIVKLLNLTNLMSKGYHIFADKVFTSLRLAKYLYSQSTFFTGTIRRKVKGIPKVLKAKLDDGDIKFVRKDYLFMLGLRQNESQALLLTTNGKAEFEQRLIQRGKSMCITNKPKVVRNYKDYHMGSLDTSDEMLFQYQDDRKTLKLWKTVAFYIFGRMVSNSYILYKYNTDMPLCRYNYIVSVIEELSKDWLALQENRPSPGIGFNEIENNPESIEEHCPFCGESRHKPAEKGL